MNLSSRTHRRAAGFSLIELMIATSISGLLASLTYPSFSGAIQRVHRSEALVAMMQLQQAQERWRSSSSRYGTLAEVGVASVALGRNYLLSVGEPSAEGYVAIAQATGSQAGDRLCRYMKLSVESGSPSYSSGETAAATNNAQGNRQCSNQ